MTLAIMAVGFIVLTMVILVVISDDEKDALMVLILAVSVVAILTLAFMGIYYDAEAKPRIIYANCIIEYQNVDKCEVLNPVKQESEE